MRGKTVLGSLLVGVAACSTPVSRESGQTESPRLEIRHPDRIHVAFAAAESASGCSARIELVLCYSVAEREQSAAFGQLRGNWHAVEARASSHFAARSRKELTDDQSWPSMLDELARELDDAVFADSPLREVAVVDQVLVTQLLLQ